MAFLSLQGIGKIYVSEGNVAVGIRGVDLSFERGEFVAITGRSGSGKSTLLNVISGMDTYEEGEIFIEGQPTSHYQQSDWELYREKYISFVFQDYNIIDSYTVLENVELALMHLSDPRERRRRAIELIERVGLKAHLHHKGSKLSGGQKQRTVIARALAKDSPIILADEPTGNLDAETSREIIALLREVSRDKLLIVVTHNFEQVEEYATRHVRIYDGAVESDHVIAPPASPDTPEMQAKESARRREARQRNGRKRDTLGNGILLGSTMFKATPRLSVFLCFLLLVGTVAISLVTSLTGSAWDAFKSPGMFRYVPGRAVVVSRDGSPVTTSELNALAGEFGAEKAVRYDYLYDQTYSFWDWDYNIDFTYVFSENGDRTPKIGRAPEGVTEAHLYLPISASSIFGKKEIADPPVFQARLGMGTVTLTVTGITYFYDNTKTAEVRLSDEGFRFLSAYALLASQSFSVRYEINDADGASFYSDSWELDRVTVDPALPAGTVILPPQTARAAAAVYELSTDPAVVLRDVFVTGGTKYRAGDGQTSWTYRADGFTVGAVAGEGKGSLTVSPDLFLAALDGTQEALYRQASLFFGSDRTAKRAIEGINEKGYLAVSSDTTYTPDPAEMIVSSLLFLLTALLWLFALLFFAFFVSLCCGRSIDAFRGDTSIMRSMGIPVKVIRIGMYVRMLLSLVPAYLLSAVAMFFIFRTPALNHFFRFPRPWQFVMIAIGVLALALLSTRRQIRRLFKTSVKSALRGGDAA